MKNDQDTKQQLAITIAIAARNEDDKLHATIDKLLKLDYEKFEIIVLDDNSSDKTNEIIKSYAHAGVRFIEGLDLPDSWNGKMWAQKQLADQAAGDYTIFIDADNPITDSFLKTFLNKIRQTDLDSLLVLVGYNSYINPIPQAIFYPWIATEFSLAGHSSPMPWTSIPQSRKVFAWIASTKKLQILFSDLYLSEERRDLNIKSNVVGQYLAHRLILSSPSSANNTGVVQSSLANTAPDRLFSISKNHKYFVRTSFAANDYRLSRQFSTIVMLAFSFASHIAVIAFIARILSTYLSLLSAFLLSYLAVGVIGIAIFLTTFYLRSPSGNSNFPLSKRLTVAFLASLFSPFNTIYSIWILVESLLRYKFDSVQWRGRNLG